MPTVTGCHLNAGGPLRQFDRLKWSYCLDLFRFGELGLVRIASKLQIHPKAGDVPKNLERRKAVLGVTPRVPRTTSLTRW